MEDLDKALPTFKESLEKSIPDSPKEQLFAERLLSHGEAQIVLVNNVTHSIHLGDQGVIVPGIITYIDRDGQRHNIFTAQIVEINTHLGYPE